MRTGWDRKKVRKAIGNLIAVGALRKEPVSEGHRALWTILHRHSPAKRKSKGASAMNRKQRRKAAKITKPKCSTPARVPVIPVDVRDDIATCVRSYTVIAAAGRGHCMYRARIGYEMLNYLGIPAQIALGGLVYRVGLDEKRDVVAFCGPGNVGMIHPQFGILGHCWLMSGADLIDFSVGDWRNQRPEDEDLLGPLQWSITPPSYFWLPRTSVEPKGRVWTPAIGSAIYTGWVGPSPVSSVEEIGEQLNFERVRLFLAKMAAEYHLKERLQEIGEVKTSSL